MDIPVVFIIYNRPDKTRRSFDAIRAVKPTTLYLVADGPKNQQDAELVAQTRQIAEQVDWNCQVSRIYASENLSCGHRIASGLDEVFRHCEKAIIIEDDIVATPAFFTFCRTMLTRYEHDPRVMSVTGWNGLVEHQSDQYDAFMSQFVNIWGWATWRRAWALYTFDPVWPIQEFQERLSAYAGNSYWVKLYTHIYTHRLWQRYQTWDFQWTMAIYYHHGHVIIPTVNLCQNIGFDIDGTHLTSFNIRGLYPAFNPVLNEEALRVNEHTDPEFDHDVLLLGIFTLYHDIRKVYMMYKNPQLIPTHQSQIGWECSLQPFREPERCLQVMTRLEAYINHPELGKHATTFRKLIKDKC